MVLKGYRLYIGGRSSGVNLALTLGAIAPARPRPAENQIERLDLGLEPASALAQPVDLVPVIGSTLDYGEISEPLPCQVPLKRSGHDLGMGIMIYYFADYALWTH